MFQLFLILTLAHFTADFVLQQNSHIKLKRTNVHKGLQIHILSHFIASFLAANLYFFFVDDQTTIILINSLIISLAIAAAHYLIDWWKESIQRRYDHVFISSSLFVLDQITHLLSILFLLYVLGFISFSYTQLDQNMIQFLFDGIKFPDTTKLLLILNLLIIATEGAGYFLGILLRNLGPNPSLNKGTYSITDEKTEIKTFFNDKGEEVNEVTTIKTEQFYKDSSKKIGRYIGMIERVLIIIFIVQGFPHGLTFLIAIKSLTRFKQFENKQFAEYYLIGSLSSALIAVVLGYTVLRII